MRAVIQRVSSASVRVNGEEVGEVGAGLLVLAAAGVDDEGSAAPKMAAKIVGLRVFPDGDGKMNLSVGDIGGDILLVSQFTLYGDTKKGNRPSFIRAAAPEVAGPALDALAEALRSFGIGVQTGSFGAHMEVELVNHGPVTLIIDT